MAPGNTEHGAPRAGIVAVVGAANVGKSTLINAVLGEKVSIVSPVVQTTRNIVRAILTEPRGQLVFMDTPGVHKAKYDLGRMMNRMARAAAEGVDVVLLVLDATRPPREEDEGWIRRLMREDQEASVLALLNKSDRKPEHADAYRQLWTSVAEEKQATRSAEWMAASGLTGQGVDALTARLFDLVPEGPLLFPADVLTDYPRQLNMADVVREKYAHRLKDELPHDVAVFIEGVEEGEKQWTVRGTVYVNRHSQKGIVLGAKGKLLKTVTAEAEKELSEMYGLRVKVELWVKVEKDWNRNFWMLQKLGYA